MPTRQVEAGELTASEILDALDDGSRLVVRTEMLGGIHEVTLRHDGTTYYCDTPTTLHKHDTSDAMRECIERMGYARGGDDSE
jgi:hemin uptake protein HemP